MDINVRLANHFWPKVDTTGDCWIWHGATGRRGYGLFYDGQRLVPAHRFVYAVSSGAPIPPGLVICHRCDNPPCVRPEHLFLGTMRENMQDASTKGRMATGDRNTARAHPETHARGDVHYARTSPERLARGECHGRTTLTEAQVRAIRARFTGRNGSVMAREYGVDKTTISNIIRRRTWAHVL